MIRQARSNAGVGQAELGARIGKPQSFVSKIESGERRVDVLELRAICRALDLPFGDFVQTLDAALPSDDCAAADERPH
jgi:transcriptional regulator with XRE-family HTH domain